MKIIALEESFATKRLLQLEVNEIMSDYKYVIETSQENIHTDISKAMLDLGETRIAAMDKAGVDMHVLSFTASQHFKDAKQSIEIMQEANNTAAAAMKKYPNRFSAFAALPFIDPKAAVLEFERALTKLGFIGTLIEGTINGEFLDDKKYWPILECAEAHNAPIYIHPSFPLPAIMQTYFKDRKELAGPEWGFMVDASCHFMRLLTAGIFDQFPKLTVILGHLGESIPYNLYRINNRLSAYAKHKLKKMPIDYLRNNLVITTSGNFSISSLLCAAGTIGIDNILFSVDWPHESHEVAVDFLKHIPVTQSDLEKIAYKNAIRVLGLKNLTADN